MEIMREIEIAADARTTSGRPSPRRQQLEEWFANEVELDPRPGGRGVFRWDNGEDARARRSSRSSEGARIVLRFDDDGIVDLRARAATDGGLASSRSRETAPSWSTALELRARSRVVRDPVDAVFSALADPSRRFVVETLAARGTATPTELAAELPVTPPGRVRSTSPPSAKPGSSRRPAPGRETRYGLTPAPARVGGRLDRGRRRGLGRAARRRSSASSSPAIALAPDEDGHRERSRASERRGPCRRSPPSATRVAGRPSSPGTRRGRSSPSRAARRRAGRA